ncbi:MAG: hypothetical protein KBC58_08280 [Flavobacterium sp.]|nr:hypothetical protein [Flavobacterium sp.]
MTIEEIENSVLKIEGLGGMTVNERLYVCGLMDEFDNSLKNDKNKARLILELLKVDQLSIEKVLNN